MAALSLAQRRLRWPVSLLGGAALIAALAILMQAFIQGVLGIRWVIHWTETVPLIAVFFAYLIDRRIRQNLP